MRQLDVIRAAHRRLQRGGGEDSGFVLIYVLMIITIVTVLVSSVLVVSASSAIPAVQSAYGQAASAAAQAGIEDLKARADKVCTGTAAACVGQLPGSLQNTWIAINQPTTGYTAQYKWSYVATAAGLLRVTSTGQVTEGGLSVSRTLVADLAGGTSTSCFDYSGCTQYETQAPDVMAQLFPNRTISLSAGALANADAAPGATGTSVTWNGPGAPANTTTTGTVNSCNDYYYNPTTGIGRETHGPSGAATSYVDWSETGSIGSTAVLDYQPCQVSFGSSTKLLAPTTTANGVGGYATNDAPLFSNSNPGSSGGPLLNQPIYTTYAGATDPGGVAGQNYRSFTLPGYTLAVGGAPASGSTYPSPQTVTSVPGAITSAPSVPANSCVYQGQTRVLFNTNGTATITSPGTTAAISGSPSWCYPATLTGGIYFYTTPVLSTVSGFSGVFSVNNHGSPANPTVHTSTGWNTTGQNSKQTASSGNTVFYTSSAAAPNPDTATLAAGSYTQAGQNPQTWSAYSSTKKCGAVSRNTNTPNGPKPWDEQTFQCDWFGQMGNNNYLPALAPNDGYTAYQNAVAADLASATALTVPGNSGNSISATVNGSTSPKTVDCSSQSVVPMTATADQLVCLLQHELRSANTGTNEANWANPPTSGYTHQYIVSGYNQTTSTATVNVGAAPGVPGAGSDPLFDSTTQPGSVSTETVTTTTTTYNIASQVYMCYGVVVLGLCLLNVGGPLLGYQWGDGTTSGQTSPQFQFTITKKTYSNFSQGRTAAAYFPFMADVTQYATGASAATGPGDLYVEGTPNTSVALVAANDVIVTGSLTPGGSGTGIEVAAQDNVRVYHPVSCLATASAAAINATTAGFCPDDLTGLYKTIPANTFRPYQQYTNLRPDLSGMSINAAVFALGQATGSPCPKWASAGTCGGEFTVDNYNRGGALAALAVTGTVYQVHHGALGEEWEVPDTTGQSRPTSGYTLTLRYQNLKTALSGFSSLLQSAATIASLWHTVSVSTAGAS